MEFHNTEDLLARGLVLPDPQTVYVSRDVDLSRLEEGVILYPGSRVSGEHTVLAKGSAVGTQGVANLRNVAMASGASIASGTAEDCTLLTGASLGPNAQVRSGSILEEGASTAHAVGLKQTILLSYVTLGSLINFCDCLMAGGTSRSDHSEVGSGFIHFNFTPFGKKGDKATASLFGDVTSGVFLNQDRIFLGGSGGVVGPIHVDYGTTLAAGSVYRKDYASDLLVYGEKVLPKSRPFDPQLVRRAGQRVAKCMRYIGQLLALRDWYEWVRKPNARGHHALVLDHALGRIDSAIKERIKQVDRFLTGATPADDAAADDIEQTQKSFADYQSTLDDASPRSASQREVFLSMVEIADDHVAWVQSLDDRQVAAGRAWLEEVARVP